MGKQATHETTSRERLTVLIDTLAARLREEPANTTWRTALYSARCARGDFAALAQFELRTAMATGSLVAFCRSLVYLNSYSPNVARAYMAGLCLLGGVSVLIPNLFLGIMFIVLALVNSVVFIVARDLVLNGTQKHRVGIVLWLTMCALINFLLAH